MNIQPHERQALIDLLARLTAQANKPHVDDAVFKAAARHLRRGTPRERKLAAHLDQAAPARRAELRDAAAPLIPAPADLAGHSAAALLRLWLSTTRPRAPHEAREVIAEIAHHLPGAWDEPAAPGTLLGLACLWARRTQHLHLGPSVRAAHADLARQLLRAAPELARAFPAAARSLTARTPGQLGAPPKGPLE